MPADELQKIWFGTAATPVPPTGGTFTLQFLNPNSFIIDTGGATGGSFDLTLYHNYGPNNTVTISTFTAAAIAAAFNGVFGAGFTGIELGSNFLLINIDTVAAGSIIYQYTTVSDATTGGTGVVLNTATTTSLDWNASAATIQSALESLPNIGAGNILVTDIPGEGFIIDDGGDTGSGYADVIYDTTGSGSYDTRVIGLPLLLSDMLGPSVLPAGIRAQRISSTAVLVFRAGAADHIINPSIGSASYSGGTGVTVYPIRIGLQFEFQGTLADANVDQIAISSSLLQIANAFSIGNIQSGTTDTPVTPSIATTVVPVTPVSEVQVISLDHAPSGGTLEISGGSVSSGAGMGASDVATTIAGQTGLAVSVSGTSGLGPFTVTYTSPGDVSDSLLNFAGSSLTYSVPVTPSISSLVSPIVAVSEVQTIQYNGADTASGGLVINGTSCNMSVGSSIESAITSTTGKTCVATSANGFSDSATITFSASYGDVSDTILDLTGSTCQDSFFSAVTPYVTNDVQGVTGQYQQNLLSFDSVPTSGTYDFSVNGSTVTVAYDRIAALLQSDIRSFGGILSTMTVSGDTTIGFTFTWDDGGFYGSTTPAVSSYASLAYASAVTVSVSTSTQGITGVYQQDTVTFNAVPTGGTWDLAAGGSGYGTIHAGDSAATIQSTIAGAFGFSPYTTVSGNPTSGIVITYSDGSTYGTYSGTVSNYTSLEVIGQSQQVSFQCSDIPTEGSYDLIIAGGSLITEAYNASAATVATATGWSVVGGTNAVAGGPLILQAPTNTSDVSFTISENSTSLLRNALGAEMVTTTEGSGGSSDTTVTLPLVTFQWKFENVVVPSYTTTIHLQSLRIGADAPPLVPDIPPYDVNLDFPLFTFQWKFENVIVPAYSITIAPQASRSTFNGITFDLDRPAYDRTVTLPRTRTPFRMMPVVFPHTTRTITLPLTKFLARSKKDQAVSTTYSVTITLRTVRVIL